MELDMQKPDNSLVWAILSTVLCCLPFGIVAIIKATQVDTHWAAGNYETACQAARDARKWCWISAGTAVAVMVVYIAVVAATVGVAVLCGGLD